MLSFSLNTRNNVNYSVPESVKKAIDSGTDRAREWVSTWYFNRLNGNADDNTNMEAYAYGCEQNYLKSVSAREVAILSEDEVKEGVKGGIGAMFLKYYEPYFENIEEMSEFISATNNLFEMSDIIEIEDNVDIITAMLNALRGNTQSIDIIKQLKQKYDKLGEVLYAIMSVDNWSGILTSMRGELRC